MADYKINQKLKKRFGYLLVHRYDASETTLSSSAEEGNLPNREKRKLRLRINDYENIIALHSDEEFRNHFRPLGNTFQDALRFILSSSIVALWTMATTDSYRSVCDRFNVGRATAVGAVRRVCHALIKRATRFIQWLTGDRAITVMRGFEGAGGFRKAI